MLDGAGDVNAGVHVSGGNCGRMISVIRASASILLLLIGVAAFAQDSTSEGAEPGRTATCDELIGFWKLVPLNDASINEVDPWPLPFQWFIFTEDGHVSSMMATEDRELSRSDLEEVLSELGSDSPTYRCEEPWLIIEYPELPGQLELWGKNIFIRRAGLQNAMPFEVGDVVLTLADPDDRHMIYYRWLRKAQ
jgi:hypothetical protein